MQVQGPPSGQSQHLRRQHEAEVEGEKKVGFEGGHLGQGLRVLHALRVENGNPSTFGPGGQGLPPDLFTGVVPVGEDRRDVEAMALEGVETQTPEGVIAQEDGAGVQG
jgi:hypothetical protein